MTDISSKTLGKVLTSPSYRWTSAMVEDLLRQVNRQAFAEAAELHVEIQSKSEKKRMEYAPPKPARKKVK